MTTRDRPHCLHPLCAKKGGALVLECRCPLGDGSLYHVPEDCKDGDGDYCEWCEGEGIPEDIYISPDYHPTEVR